MKMWIFLLFLANAANLFAQVSDPLAGKKYTVTLYLGKEHDSKQALAFENGNMTFSEAEKYGFTPDTYKWKQKNDSTITFLSISKSAKNGSMTWEGKVINDHIEGTCIWTRKVENPANYTFKGSRIDD